MLLVLHALVESAAMFWEVLWALVLGFVISAAVQVLVSKEQMAHALGRAGLREVVLATGLGAASSSCSYAAAAAAKSAFKKGAALVPTLAFMFASTNLVFELGAVLWLLMGWRFVLAEFAGAFVLIAFMWTIVRFTLPKGLVEEARTYGEAGLADDHDHGSHDHSAHGGPDRQPPPRLTAIADAFAMDWSMLWKEIVAGFLISGFVAVFVPPNVWRAMFLSGAAPPALKLVENALVGPLVAAASFVCSVGNIPLASVLWSGGIDFGGVISFIYADLIVIPLIVIYAHYYGRRMCVYITAVMYCAMVLAGICVDIAFRAMHLVPLGPRPISPIMHAGFAWNTTTWLDIPALAVAAILAAAHFGAARRGRDEMPDHPDTVGP